MEYPAPFTPRVLSVPPTSDHTNTYLQSWYKTADVKLVLQTDQGTSWGRAVFNPIWLWKNRHEFDAYHIQWEIRLYRWPLVVISAALCRCMGKRLLWTVHEILPHQGKGKLNTWIMGLFLARLANKVIVHNRLSAEKIKKILLCTRPVELIEIPDYRILPVEQKQAKLRLNEDRFVFLYFGYFKWYKGVDILIKNFDAKILQAVLYVLGHFGKNSAKRDMLSFAQNGVIIKSENMSEEMLDLHISAADVVVFPYRVCYTSAAVHRALQHDKVLVVSSAVGKTIDLKDSRIVEYKTEKNLVNALLIARQTATRDARPKLSLNIDREDYQAKIRSLYRD